MLVSESRNEKNLQSGREDYHATKRIKLNLQRVENLKVEIEREKEAIHECLNQNLFSMAKSKIEHIEKLNQKIQSL